MKGRMYIAALAALLVGVLAHSTAHAASPESATITKAKRKASWSGGPFTLSQPGLGSDCLGGSEDPTCDYFALKVNLGEGARIEVAITTPNACSSDCTAPPAEGDDYDLFVYTSDGALVGEKATAAGNEKLVFTHRARYRGKPYEVRVTPWLVAPGSTYKGSVKALSVGR